MEAGVIDLRSDAVTRPTEEMWEALSRVRLGWAYQCEDESVNELQVRAAELSGMEASLLLPTGTMANLVALMTHTERGDQIVLEASSHILWSEAWSFAYICGLLPRVIHSSSGRMPLDEVKRAIEEQRFDHRPRTSLICLENTHNIAGGTIVTQEELSAISKIAHEHNIPVHLDGARVLNACVALQTRLDVLVADIDTLTINLNKGLSAPAGAMLCGSNTFIERSRLNVKRLGGWSIHQAGVLAVPGLVGLRTMIPQLSEDNRRAQLLGHGLENLKNRRINVEPVQTNIVLMSIDVAFISTDALLARLKEQNVLVSSLSEKQIRFVTHRHIIDDDLDRVISVVRKIFS